MRFTIPALLALAAGCGGGGSALEGIYTVDAWNENPSSCADPGPSTLANHMPMVFVKKESFFGQGFLALAECADAAGCAADANDEAVDFTAFAFESGNDDDGWTGEASYSIGPDANNMCGGGLITATLTADGEMAFDARNETRDAPPFAASGGNCDPDDAKAAAQDQPCVSLESMHATFSAEL